MSKKLEVQAVVPENKEKGIVRMEGAILVDCPDTLVEAKAMGISDEAILSNAVANWKVTLQGNIRSGLRKGESIEAIQTRLSNAKMGVAQTGGRVDPVQAYLAAFASATPEKQAEMLAELKKRATK